MIFGYLWICFLVVIVDHFFLIKLAPQVSLRDTVVRFDHRLRYVYTPFGKRRGSGLFCLYGVPYDCGVSSDGTWNHCTAAGIRCRKKTLDIHFSTTRPRASCRMKRANGCVKYVLDPTTIGKDEFVEH